MKIFKILSVSLIIFNSTLWATTLDELYIQAQKDAHQSQIFNKKREAKFENQATQSIALLENVTKELAKAQIYKDELLEQIATNKQTITVLKEKLNLKRDEIGNIDAITSNYVSSFTKNSNASILRAQYPSSDISGGDEIEIIKQLWLSMLFDMSKSASIDKFDTNVYEPSGKSVKEQVIRIGAFGLITKDNYLIFDSKLNILKILSANIKDTALIPNYINSDEKQAKLMLDLKKGATLEMLTHKETLIDKLKAGGIIGYIIILLFVIALLVALERLFILIKLERQIIKQSQDKSNLLDNPLGRIFSCYEANKNLNHEQLELKLDDAILKETPILEKRIGFLKTLIAIAPMLGLLGTVTGMIATFQSVQMFGSSDPKLIAGGISMALVTTVLGLIAALPLMLLHTFISSKSKYLIQLLDQQSIGMMAEK